MKKLAALLLVLVMVFSLVGCVTEPSTSESTDAPATEGTDAPAAVDSTIVFNSTSEPPEMNSITTTSTGSMNVLRHIVDGLVMLDQADVPVPAVAESWDVSEDGLTYTFHLRNDVKWSNGDTVTSADFMFAWTQLFTASTAAPYASTWGGLIVGATELLNSADDAEYAANLENIGFSAPDESTFVVTLTNPYPYFLSVCAFPNLYPVNEKAYNEAGGLGSYGTEAEKLCTNGIFNITSWTHEDEIVLEKNADYYLADEIQVDKVVYKMISDSTTAYNAFVAGELDVNPVSADEAAMATGAGYNVQGYNDGSCWYLEFQTQAPGTNNANIRKALTYAIDAQSFIDNIVKNDSTVAFSFTPPAVANGEFTKAVGQIMDREGYAADGYAKAKELFQTGLDELGMTADELELVLITDDTTAAAKNAAFYQEQWKTNLGVDVAVEQMTYKARLQRMDEKDFSIVMAGWGPDYNDPMTFMDLWITSGGNNHAGYDSAEYDALIAAATSESDAAKRTEILIEAEKVLMTDMPIGPVYNRKTNYVVSDRVDGVVRTAFDDINFRWAKVVA